MVDRPMPAFRASPALIRSVHAIAAAIVLMAVVARVAHAQPAPRAGQDSVVRPAVPRVELLGGLHLGTPAGVSVALGPVYTYRQDQHDRSRFWFAFAEPGVRAGRLSVGHGRWTSNLGTAWTARASYLQLWRVGAFAALRSDSPQWRFSADFAIML
jgi:hypothetical protein